MAENTEKTKAGPKMVTVLNFAENPFHAPKQVGVIRDKKTQTVEDVDANLEIPNDEDAITFARRFPNKTEDGKDIPSETLVPAGIVEMMKGHRVMKHWFGNGRLQVKEEAPAAPATDADSKDPKDAGK